MLFSSLQHVLEISTVTTDNYRELRGEIENQQHYLRQCQTMGKGGSLSKNPLKTL